MTTPDHQIHLSSLIENCRYYECTKAADPIDSGSRVRLNKRHQSPVGHQAADEAAKELGVYRSDIALVSCTHC
jgi:hypothetical protein